jgi:hypothetical protein
MLKARGIFGASVSSGCNGAWSKPVWSGCRKSGFAGAGGERFAGDFRELTEFVTGPCELAGRDRVERAWQARQSGAEAGDQRGLLCGVALIPVVQIRGLR